LVCAEPDLDIVVERQTLGGDAHSATTFAWSRMWRTPARSARSLRPSPLARLRRQRRAVEPPRLTLLVGLPRPLEPQVPRVEDQVRLGVHVVEVTAPPRPCETDEREHAEQDAGEEYGQGCRDHGGRGRLQGPSHHLRTTFQPSPPDHVSVSWFDRSRHATVRQKAV